MSKDENTLNILDGTIKAVEDITKVLKKAKDELLKLDKDKAQLKNEMLLLEGEKEQLEAEKLKLEQDTKNLKQETIKLEKEKQERDQKIGALTDEQIKLLDEYNELKVELKKFAKTAAEAEESEFNFERIKALLSIYTVLIDKIFQGQPHYKILEVLHGDKEILTRDELKNTTGIGGIFILRSVQELDKVGLVEYDIDNGTAKLKKRLFPKKALEEK